MGTARRLALAQPSITCMLFVADNPLAIQNITKQSVHLQQSASIAFLDSAHMFFSQDSSLLVSIGWVKSNKGTTGNERANTLAKVAVLSTNTDVCFGLAKDTQVGATISFAWARAKECIITEWQSDWHPGLVGLARRAIGYCLPSWLLAPEVSGSVAENQRWGACAFQVCLGHGWLGEYYTWLNLLEDSECHCTAWQTTAGKLRVAPIVQTRKHLLLHCPTFAKAHVRHFHDLLLGKLMLVCAILGSANGNCCLCTFLQETNTFFKSRPPLQPPEAPDLPDSA